MDIKAQRADAFARAQELSAKSAELSEEEITEFENKLAEVKSLDEKIAKIDASSEMFKSLNESATPAENEIAVETKNNDRPAGSLGEHFVKHAGERLTQLKGTTGWSVSVPEFIPSKANTDTQVTGGPTGDFADWLVQVDRTIVRAPRQRLVVADLLGSGTLSGNSIRYYVEGAFEGDFATVAEGGQKPQVHVGEPTPEIDALTKIAAWIRFTDETLEDLPFWVSEINNRLLYKLAAFEEAQLLNGDGAGTNLLGLRGRGIQTLSRQGGTPADATDDEPIADVLFRAMTAVSTATDLSADALVINPSDYQSLRLAKDGNDQYMGGGFFQGQYGNGVMLENPPVWGLRTVVTPAVSAGTAIVGNFSQGGTVYRKGGVRVESTNSNATDFTSNHVVTRAEERLALAVRQPLAFVEVDLSTPA